MTGSSIIPAPHAQTRGGSLFNRATGIAGLAGGLLFFVGDMLMYGHWGSAVNFPAGAVAAVRQMSLGQLYLGGLVGPVAACLCAIGFWHVSRHLHSLFAARLILGLSAIAMVMLGAVHVLWVTRGLARRLCVNGSEDCTALAAQLNDYWNIAYYVAIAPAYLGCAILALVVLRGQSKYPRWTVIFNPAVSLLITPALVFVPAPLGAPLVGGDANLFIALFFAVSLATTWRSRRDTASVPERWRTQTAA